MRANMRQYMPVSTVKTASAYLVRRFYGEFLFTWGVKKTKFTLFHISECHIRSYQFSTKPVTSVMRTCLPLRTLSTASRCDYYHRRYEPLIEGRVGEKTRLFVLWIPLSTTSRSMTCYRTRRDCGVSFVSESLISQRA